MKCAVNDIRITIGFPRHWKTKRLRRRVGDDGPRMLICLWESAAQSYQDGNLEGLDNAAIADASEWPGEPDEWIAALTDALPGHSGWLDGEPGSFRLHDWAEHQPWVVEAPLRSEHARKAAIARHSKPEVKDEHARSMPGACPEHARSMPGAMPLSLPSPSWPNPSDPTHTTASGKEQKKEDPSDLPAPSPRKTRTPKPKPADKPYLDMDGSWEWMNVTDDYRKAWAQDFPGIDLDDELRKARAWVRADPAKRRKTNWLRFLAGVWFPKAQQSASGSAGKPNHADYRALDRAAEREWQRVMQSGASNDFQKIGFAVAMLHPRTIAALKVIDKDPANAVWKMADIPIRDQLTYKAAFLPAWKASGIPYEVDE